MSMYRCAACGSPNVVPDTQAGGVGFNYLKGTVGTLVLGPGGTAAGIESKQEQVYKCPDCGLTLSYPMEPIMKTMIDLGVESLEGRKHLTFGNGVSISWDWLKKQYKNIEKGPADAELAKRKTKTLAMATATKEEFDAAVDIIGDTIRRRRLPDRLHEPREEDDYALDNPMTIDEYLSYKTSVKTIVENIIKFLPPPLEFKYRDYLDRFTLEELLIAYIDDGTFPYCDRGYEMQCKWEIEHGKSGELIRQISLAYGCSIYSTYLLPANGSLCEFPSVKVPMLTHLQRTALLKAAEFKGGFMGIQEYYNCQLPLVTIKNGLLGFGIHSFTRWDNNGKQIFDYLFDMNELVEDYFKEHPEKKEEITNQVAEYKKSVSDYEERTKENEQNRTALGVYQAQIETNNAKICVLEKKIFGKAKAQAEIASLKEENRKAEEGIDRLNGLISAFEKLEKPISGKDFIDRIVTDNGAFIVWRWVYKQDVPEAEVPAVEEKKEDAPHKGENTASIPEQIKQYAELLSIGAITQEEYDAKKKQLLRV